MSTASSVTYFVMSIVSLFFLYGCHEAASYMLLKYTPFIILLYGVTILTLGIVCMAIDVGGANQAAQDIWKTMSMNQKDFFKNDVLQLQAARETNTLYAGIFGIVIGSLIFVQGILSFVLRAAKSSIEDKNIEWAPQDLKSRSISKQTQHEVCDFPYVKNYPDKHLEALRSLKKQKKRVDLDDDSDDDSFQGTIEDNDFDINTADDVEEQMAVLH